MANLTIPSDKVPVVDPKTGRMDTNWYLFLKQLVKTINEGL